MKGTLDILKWLMPLVVLLATACSHDDLVAPDEYPAQTTSPYVELRIAVPAVNPSSTRSNPMGGEEGNGRERGILNEDKIHDINVFFYIEDKNDSGKGLGMDSPDETEIIKHIYYNLDNHNDVQNSQLWYPADPNNPGDYDDEKFKPYYEKGYVVIKFKCQEEDIKRIDENGGINFVAVANVGPIQYTEEMNLGKLRDKTLEYYFGSNTWTPTNNAFSKNAEDMDYFLMSTAFNENYMYGGQNTGDNKIKKVNDEYMGTTTLERMYARLDLWYNNSSDATSNNVVKDADNKIKELKYKVIEAGDNTVYLTNVLPVNVMQSPSFVFKKVIELPENINPWNAETNSNVWSTSSTVWGADKIKWGGKETPSGIPTSSPNDLPTNYVMERHTKHKNSTGSAGEVDTWYGNTAVSKVNTNIKD
ncbi:MAG: hypothetical protein K2H60_00840, partial [Muribaculaceae bacterium]|nr:hypothetical protein [Muribaculaceae bacterium]